MACTQPATSNPDLHYRNGLAALAAQRMEDAVSELREAVRLNPAMSAGWNDLGVVMEALGNPTDAMHCYGRAIEADPTHDEARENLASLTMQIDLAKALRRQAFNMSLL